MHTILKLLGSLIVVALVVWVLAFTVYNHDLISLNLWPLPYALSLSVGVFMIFCLAIGYAIGYTHRWSQTRCRSKT